MMRDGPEDTAVTSQVQTIEVGEDENGKTLTSLVVVPGETPVDAKRGWSKSLKLFREALNEVLLGSEQTVLINGAPIRAVNRESVRAEFYRIYPAKGETVRQQQDNRKHRFNYCVTKAQSDSLIGIRVNGDQTLMWVAASEPLSHAGRVGEGGEGL
jgi:hypothetical protein